MVCFSGIGGMTRVGCRSTRAFRRELNSEYLLVTSMSCYIISMKPSLITSSAGIHLSESYTR